MVMGSPKAARPKAARRHEWDSTPKEQGMSIDLTVPFKMF